VARRGGKLRSSKVGGETRAISTRKNFCVVLPAVSFRFSATVWNEEMPMYPVALYGSLPEMAYLAPRGNFMTQPPAEEERPRKSAGSHRATALAEAKPEPLPARACDH
jgi:hypothetical protein